MTTLHDRLRGPRNGCAGLADWTLVFAAAQAKGCSLGGISDSGDVYWLLHSSLAQAIADQMILSKAETGSGLGRLTSILLAFSYFLRYPVLGVGGECTFTRSRDEVAIKHRDSRAVCVRVVLEASVRTTVAIDVAAGFAGEDTRTNVLVLLPARRQLHIDSNQRIVGLCLRLRPYLVRLRHCPGGSPSSRVRSRNWHSQISESRGMSLLW